DIRAKQLWQPNDDFSATTLVEIHRNSKAPSNGEDANGNFTQAFGHTTTPHTEEDFDLYNETLRYKLGWAEALSTTTYLQQNQKDTNYSYALPLNGPAQTTPVDEVYFAADSSKTNNFNQELRLTSSDSGPWQW